MNTGRNLRKRSVQQVERWVRRILSGARRITEPQSGVFPIVVCGVLTRLEMALSQTSAVVQ